MKLLHYFNPAIHASRLMLIGIIWLVLILSACSDQEQTIASSGAPTSIEDRVEEAAIDQAESVVSTPLELQSEIDGSQSAEGSLLAEGSQLADGSQSAEGSQSAGDIKVVNKVSGELEQKGEQMNVSELEQITEADSQALQDATEEKTVSDADNQASKQANTIASIADDVATPLEQKLITTEPGLSESASLAPVNTPEAFKPIEGLWVKKSQKITGQWRIETRDGEFYLVLGDDFKTRNAPDLKFVLSNTAVADVRNKNAMNGAIFIANLKSSSGAQSYKLPSNFGDYSTLLLHCEKYTKLWGAAAIK